MLPRSVLLSSLRRLLAGVAVAGALSVPACSYQYGVGIRCSESLSNCEIYTGVDDLEKTSDAKE